MRDASVLVVLAGLGVCASSVSLAQGGLEPRSRTDLRVERAPAWTPAPVGRGGSPFPPGSLVTMRDELEGYPVDTSLGGDGVSAPPTSFTGPPGFVWPVNNLRGQMNTNFVRLVDLSGAPVSGTNGVANASKAVRIFASAAQPSGNLFLGLRLRFGGPLGEPTVPLEPIAGTNARVSSEHWLSDVNSRHTFEPSAAITGYLTGQMHWGGACQEGFPGCGDPEAPGLIDYFAIYGPSLTADNWHVGRYCEGAHGTPIAGCTPPPGHMSGDIVRPPVQSWFRLAAETTVDGRLRFLINLLDGSAEAAFYENALSTGDVIDTLSWNATFESQGSLMLVDNVEASGALYTIPDPPALECPYHDDLEWLPPGLLFGQSPRWFAALTSAAQVVTVSGSNRLRQVNDISSDNEFRQEMNTSLPASSAQPGGPWKVCIDAATTEGTGGGPAARAVALESADGLTARIYLGITDPFTGLSDSMIYVQTNPNYSPVDDPSGTDPLANAPQVGIDVLPTGFAWPADGEMRTLCITVAHDNSMIVSLDGVTIYTGAAFSDGASVLRVESENTATGAGARLDVDNVTLSCATAACADANGDGVVTFADLNAVLGAFGGPGSGLTGDVTGDGLVDFADLNAVLAAFGGLCH